MSDKAISFFFKDIAVKGNICRIDNSINQAFANHIDYPSNIKKILAEMVCFTNGFMMDIKTGNCHGTIQTTGDGLAKIALVDFYSQTNFRCCATFNDIEKAKNSNNINSLFGSNAQLSLTIDINEQRYQTILPIISSGLEASFQNYFLQSQQIPTIIFSKSTEINGQIKAGFLMLQKMPSENPKDNEAWEELSILTSTLKTEELLSSEKTIEEIIFLLYHEHQPIVSRETNLSFRCSCSKEKIESIISQLSNQETESKVTCEFCGKEYLIKNK